MSLVRHEHIRFRNDGLSRRRFIKCVSTTALATGALSLQDMLSLKADELQKKRSLDDSALDGRGSKSI